MNLFVSFILRAISVFIKDGVLYAEEDSNHCFVHPVSYRHALLPTRYERCINSSSGHNGAVDVVAIVIVKDPFSTG